MEKSNLDVAYDIMSARNESIAFKDLWAEVCKIQGFKEEEAPKRVGKFYTCLFLDGRFITLGENVWDLRDRYTFDKVHIDMNEVYHDDDDEPIEDEEEIIIEGVISPDDASEEDSEEFVEEKETY